MNERRRHTSASPYEERYGFSRAVRVGNHIHVAGTAPIGPDGRTVEGDAHAQTLRCLEVGVAAIEALGGSAKDVVRTRMYIVDPVDADAVGRAHREVLDEARPAATMVVVAALLDPVWRIELELDAVVPE